MEKVLNYDSKTIKNIFTVGTVTPNSPAFKAAKTAAELFEQLGNLLASGNISEQAFAQTCVMRDLIRAKTSVQEVISLGWNDSFGKGGTA